MKYIIKILIFIFKKELSVKKQFWLKIHTYVAIFFLPFMLLFAATGVGHLLGFNQFAGASKQTFELNIEPISSKDELRSALKNTLKEHDLFIPGAYERVRDGRFSLNNAKYSASISNKNGKMVVEYSERTWFGTMYSMHFGHGSDLFTWLSIVFSVFIFVVYLSGFIVTAWCKRYQKSAIMAFAIGSFVVAFCYFQSINI